MGTHPPVAVKVVGDDDDAVAFPEGVGNVESRKV